MSVCSAATREARNAAGMGGRRARAAMCSPWRGHVEGKKDKGEGCADERRVTFLPGRRKLTGSVQPPPLPLPTPTCAGTTCPGKVWAAATHSWKSRDTAGQETGCSCMCLGARKPQRGAALTPRTLRHSGRSSFWSVAEAAGYCMVCRTASRRPTWHPSHIRSTPPCGAEGGCKKKKKRTCR